MKPHKHAELIKAWADGAEIQMKNVNGVWIDIYPEWIEDCEYRLTPKSKLNVPDGLIDPKSYYQGYEDGKNHVEYRIKPEPKPDWCMYLKRIDEHTWTEYLPTDNIQKGKVKLTFDGETGELKSAEILK